MRRKCLPRSASYSVLTGPGTQKGSMQSGSREELFPDKKSKSAGLAVDGSSEKNTGMPLDSKQNSFCVHVWLSQRPFFMAKGKE